MAELKTQISGVRYNAAEEQFEALVTFHGDFGRHSIAATSRAPLTAEFEQITDELLRDALRHLNDPSALQAHVAQAPFRSLSPSLPHAA